jgi:hypothetical protein
MANPLQTGLTGLVGSWTDVATLLTVLYLAAEHRARWEAARAWIVALAKRVDGVRDDRAQSELDVEGVDVDARLTTDGGRERDGRDDR